MNVTRHSTLGEVDQQRCNVRVAVLLGLIEATVASRLLSELDQQDSNSSTLNPIKTKAVQEFQ